MLAYEPGRGSILQGDWQLILHEHDKPLLFNVLEDPAESNNLAGQLQQVEQDLSARLTGLAVQPAH